MSSRCPCVASIGRFISDGCATKAALYTQGCHLSDSSFLTNEAQRTLCQAASAAELPQHTRAVQALGRRAEWQTEGLLGTCPKSKSGTLLLLALARQRMLLKDALALAALRHHRNIANVLGCGALALAMRGDLRSGGASQLVLTVLSKHLTVLWGTHIELHPPCHCSILHYTLHNASKSPMRFASWPAPFAWAPPSRGSRTPRAPGHGACPTGLPAPSAQPVPATAPPFVRLYMRSKTVARLQPAAGCCRGGGATALPGARRSS